MKVTYGDGRIIVSLCDYSGNWPKPYADAGYTVIQFDLKHGDDITAGSHVLDCIDAVQTVIGEARVVGILMAPPCTDFTVSGAQYWPAKDADGRTAKSLDVVLACLTIKDAYPGAWWALENPVGRLPSLLPGLGKPRFYFHPYEYAQRADAPASERYTKKTGIWGRCIKPLTDAERHTLGEGPAPLEPIRVCAQGSWVQRLGGKSERTKELRSMTPTGFARAFFLTHP